MSDAGARKGTGSGGAKNGANKNGKSGKPGGNGKSAKNDAGAKSGVKRRRIVVTWGGAKGRPNRLTGRAGVLALVVCVLAIALVVPARQYLDQRRERADLREQTEKHRTEVERLRDELERWKDPAYIRQQARGQLHFVNPGDTAYSVVPPPAGASSASGAPQDGQLPANLWTTVRDADAEPKTSSPLPPPPPAPAGTITDPRGTSR